MPELLFPKPHINGFYKESHCGYTLLYIFLFIDILVLLIFLALSRKSTKGHKPKIPFESFGKQCFFLFAISVIFVNFFQLQGHFRYFSKNYRRFHGKTLTQKKQLLFGQVFNFAQKCREKVRGTCSAVLITDHNLSETTGMKIQRYLAYHLYPIKIRKHDKKLKPDCLVYLYKHDAINEIPDGYEIRYKMNKNNILAVKKGFK